MRRRKWLKRTIYFLIGIGLLLLVLWGLMHLSPVQKYVSDLVLERLSNRLDARFTIDKIKLDPFNTLVLDGIRIEDQSKDSLLFIEHITMDIGLFSFFKKKLSIKDLRVDGAIVSLRSLTPEGGSNYQFLLDSFAGTKSGAERGREWEFDVEQIRLSNWTVRWVDLNNSKLETWISHLNLEVEDLDVENRHIRLRKLLLDESITSYRQNGIGKQFEKEVTKELLPALGWRIIVDEFVLKENELRLVRNSKKKSPSTMADTSFNIQKIGATIKDLTWSDSIVEFNLSGLVAREQSGIDLKDLASEVRLTNHTLQLKEFSLLTDRTEIESDLKLLFESPSDFSGSLDKIRGQIDIRKSKLNTEEIYELTGLKVLTDRIKPGNALAVDGTLIKSDRDLGFKNLNIRMADQTSLTMDGYLTMKGSRNNHKIRVRKLRTSSAQIEKIFRDIQIPQSLKDLGPIVGEVDLVINDETILLNRARLSSGPQVHFVGDLKITPLKDLTQSQFVLSADQISCPASLFMDFLPDTIHSLLDSLGTLVYQGEIGRITDSIRVKGHLISELGTMAGEAHLGSRDTGISNFSVNMDFHDLNLRKIGLDEFGKCDGRLDLFGTGTDLETIQLQWQSDFSKLTVKKYPYEQVQINGSYLNHYLNIEGSLSDPHLSGGYSLNANLQEGRKGINGRMSIDTFNLHAIGITDHPLTLAGDLESDLVGEDWNSLEGVISIFQLAMNNQKKTISGPDFKLFSESMDSGHNRLSMISDSLNAEISGIFDYKSVPRIIEQIVQDYLPFTGRKQWNDSDSLIREDFVLRLDGTGLSEYAGMLNPKIEILNEIHLDGNIGAKDGKLTVTGYIGSILYEGIRLDSVNLWLMSDSTNFENHVSIHTISQSSMNIRNVDFRSGIIQQGLHFNLDIGEQMDNRLYSLGGWIDNSDQLYRIRLDTALILNKSQWHMDPENRIEVSHGKFEINNFNLNNASESLSLESLLDGPIAFGDPFLLSFHDYKLGSFNEILQGGEVVPTGILNGKVIIFDVLDDPFFSGDLNLGQFSISDNYIGELEVVIKNPSGRNLLEYEISVNGNHYDLVLVGDYLVESAEFKASLDVTEFDLGLLDLFVSPELTGTTGRLFGNVQVIGTLSAPVVSGLLEIDGLQSTFSTTKSQYEIPSGKIQLTGSTMELLEIVVLDEVGRSSSVSGSIGHNNFRDFSADLQIISSEFQFLNTTESDNDFVYGLLIAQASARVQGPIYNLQIEVDATTLPGTEMKLVNNYLDDLTNRDRFIVFGHPEDDVEEGSAEINLAIDNPYNFEIIANLSVTDDAGFTIIIDPISGDEFVCRGRADLTIESGAKGDLLVTGDYTFTEGKYNFNFEGLVRKEFQIRDGSTLFFPGNISNTTFAMDAIYRTKTATYALIQNQTNLTDEERREANTPVEVLLILNMRGSLDDPKISFQISAPEAEEGRVGNAVSQRLTQLNENPDELNRQVFGLLFFNSFFTDGSNAISESFTHSVETAAFASMRSLVTSQLNRLANQYIKGLQVQFDFDTYSSGQIENSMGVVTEIGVSVSKQLFNDRLSIQVGSNLNFNRENVTNWSNSDFAAVTGDFILEYKLTEKGNYLVKVFHLNDYDILEDENDYKSGMGFIIRKKLKDSSEKKQKSSDPQ